MNIQPSHRVPSLPSLILLQGIGVGKLFHFFLLSNVKETRESQGTVSGSVPVAGAASTPRVTNAPIEEDNDVGTIDPTGRTSRDALVRKG